MPEEITIDTLNHIIVVRSWGHIMPSDLASSRDRIFEIYAETGICKVLVDCREQQSFPKTFDLYRHSENVGENPISRKLKYAVVPSGQTKEELRFLETTSMNRGLNVRIHDSKEEAIEWLKGDAV